MFFLLLVDHLVTTWLPFGDPLFQYFSIVKSGSGTMASTPIFKLRLKILKSKTLMLMLVLVLTSMCKMSIKLKQLLRSFLEMNVVSTFILIFQYFIKRCILIVVTFPLLFLQLLRRYHLPLYFPFDCLNFSPGRNWGGSNLEHFHTKQAKLKHLHEKQTKLKQTFPAVLGSCRNAVKLFCKRFRVQLGQA